MRVHAGLCVRVLTKVLNAVLNGINDKHNCFQDSMEAFCGNRIVEDKEECDCGFERDCEEHGDRCCYPQEHEKKPCRRREHAMCRSVDTCSVDTWFGKAELFADGKAVNLSGVVASLDNIHHLNFLEMLVLVLDLAREVLVLLLEHWS